MAYKMMSSPPMSGETSESRAANGPAVLVSLILNALEKAKQVRF